MDQSQIVIKHNYNKYRRHRPRPAEMIGARGSKSIWKKREEGDKLFHRINRKTGRIETHSLEWERSWRNIKILKFPARFANELRAGGEPITLTSRSWPRM